MSAKHCIKQKMHISEYVCKTFLEKITFLRKEIIAVCNVSKNAALPQVFFCHTLGTVPQDFRSFSKTLSSIPLQQVTLYHLNLCMLYTPNKRCRFTTQQLVAMLHADTTYAFQTMSYANVEKDINRNEHLNLNLQNKTPH